MTRIAQARKKSGRSPVQSVIPPERFSVCMVYVHPDYSLCPTGKTRAEFHIATPFPQLSCAIRNVPISDH